MQNWIDEINDDRLVGKGKTSYEKISEQLNYGPRGRKICCRKCHTIYTYNVESQNICPANKCRNNPTYYEEGELGPYKKYNFQLKPANTVIVNEIEPSSINPNGKENLKKLYEELKETCWQEYESFPFYGDGLPGITFERMKAESVQCTTHDVNIPLVNAKLLADHCKPDCMLGN